MIDRQPVTPLAAGGEWSYHPGDPGHSGSREEPPDPGHPPFVYALVTDPETKEDRDVPIAIMDSAAYETEPDPYDEFDDGYRQEGVPAEHARLFSLVPANVRAMREALYCCREGDPEAATRALAAALAEVDSVDRYADLDRPAADTAAGISVTARPPSKDHVARDAGAFRAWRVRAEVLEYLVRRSGLPHRLSGDAEGPRLTLRARTARERGAFARFLTLAQLNDLGPYLRVDARRPEDRELVLGLGFTEQAFETDDG